MDFEKIVNLILTRCEEQSKFYHDIAYRSDYRDETISRIIDLGIAYEDVCSFIKLLVAKESENQESKKDNLTSGIQFLFESELKKFVEKQSQVATATNGFPTAVGRADCNSNENDTENNKKNTLGPVVNPVDNNEHK